MTAPDPAAVPDRVLAAVRSVPAARTPPECSCAGCVEARARETAAAEWRALHAALHTAQQIRTEETDHD